MQVGYRVEHQLPAVIRSLGPIDARSIARDSMLLWLVILTPGMGLLFRFAVPLITVWLDQ